MKALFNITFLIFSLSMCVGCATIKYSEYDNVFTFEYQEKTYQILGRNSEKGKGANVLVYRKDGVIELSARDYNQDGSIDEILKGNMSIVEANQIYEVGILQAISQGSFEQELYARTFEWRTADVVYVIKTYEEEDGSLFNRFTIYNINTRMDIILLDENANGILDSIYKGEGDIEEYQGKYGEALKKGLEEGRILKTDTIFMVLESDLFSSP